jgi:signal peptidase II
MRLTTFKKMRNSGLIWLWIAVLVLLVDHFTKMAAVNYLGFHEALPILSIFDLTLSYNTGAAFSFLDSASGWQHWFLGGLALLVSAMIVAWLARLSVRDYWMSTALCLVLGGALGNVWDRIAYGHVVDFLSFHWGDWYFAIFNIADSAICLGAFMIFCCWLKQERDAK